MAGFESLSLENPVFAGFAFYSVVVLFKMFAMTIVSGYWRAQKNVFMYEEDAKAFASKPGAGKVTQSDPDVERARRNHFNDLENIPAFVLIGFLYVLIGPSASTALWHFRVFAGARILHTLSYQMALQPWRAIFHIVSLFTQMSMGVQILMATF